LLAHGCAAARMSEGLLHIAPPFIATDSDLDFIADRVIKVLDAVAPKVANI
jgi:adenosylmethionine-8-amino-7-oxononanoate aminotransferase